MNSSTKFRTRSNQTRKQNQTSPKQKKWVNDRNLKLTLSNPYPSYTLKQKEFTKPRPVREYQRFLKTKQALSGSDIKGNLLEFYNKDIIKPMNRPSLYENFNIKNPNYKHNSLYNTKPNENSKWAINTVARANSIENLPKVQQFENYYFPPKYNNKDVEKYRAFSLKSDHIGIKVPRIQKVKSEFSFLKLKKDYGFFTETKDENRWKPYFAKDSNNNLSSKDYNIINFSPIYANSSNCLIMNKTLNFRKRGMGEYCDLTKTFCTNFNKDFTEKINSNPNRFHKYTGVFSNMYDASHKNGDIIPPFDHKKSNK